MAAGNCSESALDWMGIAHGVGVHATRAQTAEQFNEQLETTIHNPGPHYPSDFLNIA
jgi:hypothetical protein